MGRYEHVHALRGVALKTGKDQDWRAVWAAQAKVERETEETPVADTSPAAASPSKMIEEDWTMGKRRGNGAAGTEGAPKTRASGIDLARNRFTAVVRAIRRLGKTKVAMLSDDQFTSLCDGLAREVADAEEAMEASRAPKGPKEEQIEFPF